MMSGDYINRYAVLNTIDDAIAHNALSYEGCVNEIMEFIAKLPAADVRPVVKGQNICDTVMWHCEFKCSVCGVDLSSVYGGHNDFGLDGGYFNFCPNCGAMMEES